MGAMFFNGAIFQNNDPVHTLNGRQAVGDDNGGPAFHEFPEGVLN
jgi:hypothetical protein